MKRTVLIIAALLALSLALTGLCAENRGWTSDTLPPELRVFNVQTVNGTDMVLYYTYDPEMTTMKRTENSGDILVNAMVEIWVKQASKDFYYREAALFALMDVSPIMIDCWNPFESRFNAIYSRAAWQYKLYDALIQDKGEPVSPGSQHHQ